VMAAAVADFRPKAAASASSRRTRSTGDRARADARHPRRARAVEAARSDPRRLRGRDG
jgi:hypothetical protein